ncbi:MAG: ATP synthase subunit I [Lachnospiraceae bacterium]|nr:ATP synthase subunit I [Lachnospiraceae bacterium]
MSRRYPGLGGMLREMFRDNPEDYRDPEDIDRETEAEEAEQRDGEDPDEVVDYIPVGSEREKEELRNAEETLWDLRFGIVVLSIAVLPLAWFADPAWKFMLGTVIGCVLALFLVQKMYQGISNALMMDPAGAVKYTRKQVALRYFLTFAVLALSMFLGGIAMGAGTILASFTIKPAAYFQPWFRKLRLWCKGLFRKAA